MKSALIVVLLVFLISSKQIAQFPVYVTKIETIVNESVAISGNLSQGAPMENLSWAWKNNNNCFEATQKLKFSGNHVLYSIVVPPHSTVEIIVSPQNTNVNLSLYAYLLEQDDYSTVPDLKKCIACEADYRLDKEKQHDCKRIISITTNSTENNLIIGVVGSNGLKNAEYTMEISMYDLK